MERFSSLAGVLVSFLALTATACKVGAPGKIETSTINAIKHRLTVRGKKEISPLPQTPETFTTGREAFGHYCIACHGKDGQNTGVPFAGGMSPPIPPLNSAEVQGYTDGQLKWIIDNGISPSGMPASKGTLSDDEIWAMVYYIRHLPPAGSVGEPEMYSH